MTIADLVGEYSVIGSNQNDSEVTYKGTLSLQIDDFNRIIAKWLIHNEQEQFGVGFFKDNILVINFHYFGDNKESYHGTVVYKCLTKDILEGFWSEEYGDPKFLGSERCFRIENAIEKV